MIYLTAGTNEISIPTSYFLESGVTISILNTSTREEKEFSTGMTAYTERYFTFDIILVNKADENLSLGKMYLPNGQHIITITQDDFIYKNILTVESTLVAKKVYSSGNTLKVYKK